ncbi:hypothetical protein TrRE_jg13619, partial [Triparma retinervis]
MKAIVASIAPHKGGSCKKERRSLKKLETTDWPILSSSPESKEEAVRVLTKKERKKERRSLKKFETTDWPILSSSPESKEEAEFEQAKEVSLREFQRFQKKAEAHKLQVEQAIVASIALQKGAKKVQTKVNLKQIARMKKDNTMDLSKGLLKHPVDEATTKAHDGAVCQEKEEVVVHVEKKRARSSRNKKRWSNDRNKKKGRRIKVIKGAKAYVPVEEDPLVVEDRTSEKASLLDNTSRCARKIAGGVRIISRKLHWRKINFRKMERRAKDVKRKAKETKKLAKQKEMFDRFKSEVPNWGKLNIKEIGLRAKEVKPWKAKETEKLAIEKEIADTHAVLDQRRNKTLNAHMNTVIDSTVSNVAVKRIAALATNPICDSMASRIQRTLDDYRDHRSLLAEESSDDSLLRPYGGSHDAFVNTIDDEGLTNHLVMLAEVTLNDPQGGNVHNLLKRKVGELEMASQWPDVTFTVTKSLLKTVVATVEKMNPAFAVPKKRRPVSMPPHLMTVLLTTNVGRKDYVTDSLLFSICRCYGLRAVFLDSLNLPLPVIVALKTKLYGPGMREVLALSRLLSVDEVLAHDESATRKRVPYKSFWGRHHWDFSPLMRNQLIMGGVPRRIAKQYTFHMLRHGFVTSQQVMRGDAAQGFSAIGGIGLD